MNILDCIKYHRSDATYIGHRTRKGWHGALPHLLTQFSRGEATKRTIKEEIKDE